MKRISKYIFLYEFMKFIRSIREDKYKQNNTVFSIRIQPSFDYLTKNEKYVISSILVIEYQYKTNY